MAFYRVSLQLVFTLLYALVAETLACTIRPDPIIGGLHLPVGNAELHVSQYANDTTPCVDRSFFSAHFLSILRI